MVPETSRLAPATAAVGPAPDRFPWGPIMGAAVLVVMGASALLRLPPPPQPRAPEVAARLQLSHLDEGLDQAPLQEELVLQDPLPLFLPTPWNSGQADLRAALRPVPTARFSSFQPKYTFDRNLELPVGAAGVPPADALAATEKLLAPVPLHGLSQVDTGTPPLPPRLFHLQVRSIADGSVRLELEGRQAEDAGGNLGVLQQEFWAPVEAMVVIDAAGVVGQPTLSQTSGSEAVDSWALEFLETRAGLGLRLTPGFYRVVLGP